MGHKCVRMIYAYEFLNSGYIDNIRFNWYYSIKEWII